MDFAWQHSRQSVRTHVREYLLITMAFKIYIFNSSTYPPRGLFKIKASPWASYQIRKIAGCACAGNAGKVFPHRRFQRKPLVSDPGMHHGTCVTHVPWCMSGSLTCGDGENVPGIPRACAPAILRIWQEAHVLCFLHGGSMVEIAFLLMRCHVLIVSYVHIKSSALGWHTDLNLIQSLCCQLILSS